MTLSFCFFCLLRTDATSLLSIARIVAMRDAGIASALSARTASERELNLPLSAIATRVRLLIASTTSLLIDHLFFFCVLFF